MKPYLAGIAHATVRDVSNLLEQARNKLRQLMHTAECEGDTRMDGNGRLVVHALDNTEQAELWLRDVYDSTHPTNVALSLSREECRAQCRGARGLNAEVPNG
jgi:predicted transcriptional regulator of viral defense system